MDVSELRKNYTKGGLRRTDLDDDPLRQFEKWFGEAMASGIPEPNAMSLATATAGGAPSLRTVLLKSYDARGLVFYTSYESRKAREIAENPRVALMFPWVTLERQIVITGTATKISAAESLKYFVSRPRGNQLGAWVSHQSHVISSRQILLAKLDEMKRKFASGQIPLPPAWGGYRVTPDRIEFWQGGEDRLHDRFLYALQPDGSWAIERLAP
ncbi:MAG TPA: pyridoxamine 5'-phosphate oxidase [Verrucomicrobiae bacterium]|nr:pyridoxamine 5'-phosphate oxidase [Verrucomicrobiae bacterium]